MFNGINIFLICIAWLPSIESKPNFQFICEKNISAPFFTTDHLNNFYVVDKNELILFNADCKKEKLFSTASTFSIDAIDVSDPFKILIFNKDFNQLLFLNNQLARITDPIALDQYGYYTVSAVCASAKGGFWIFDQANLQLVYFTNDFKELRKSTHLNSFFKDGTTPSDIVLLEKNDYIYLGIPEVGILMFDHYGSYIKTLPVKFGSGFQVVNQDIIYYQSGQLFFYDTLSLEQKSFALPVDNVLNARIENQLLYTKQKNTLLIYQWKNTKSLVEE